LPPYARRSKSLEMLKKASPIALFLRNAPDGPEIVRSAEWPTLGALIPQAVD
jgi:hypothetical protein